MFYYLLDGQTTEKKVKNKADEQEAQVLNDWFEKNKNLDADKID